MCEKALCGRRRSRLVALKHDGARQCCQLRMQHTDLVTSLPQQKDWCRPIKGGKYSIGCFQLHSLLSKLAISNNHAISKNVMSCGDASCFLFFQQVNTKDEVKRVLAKTRGRRTDHYPEPYSLNKNVDCGSDAYCYELMKKGRRQRRDAFVRVAHI